MTAVLIVGPGQHFGTALCRKFASHGYDVGTISRSAPTPEMRASVEAFGQRYAHASVDVLRHGPFREALHALSMELSPVECLIYNVKVSPRGPAMHVPSSEVAAALDANIAAAMVTVQSAPEVLAPGRKTTLILTGGGFKDRPDESRLALSASKAALDAIARGMRLTLQSQHDIGLKTLVIDGFVRQDGPIFPPQVANAFFALASSRRATLRLRPDPALQGQLSLGLEDLVLE